MFEVIDPDFIHEDARGKLVQLVHEGYKQVNIVSSKGGMVRGGHYHRNNSEAFYVISGKCEVKFIQNGFEESHVFSSGDFFKIGPGVGHIFNYLQDTLLVGLYSNGVEIGGKKDIIQIQTEGSNIQLTDAFESLENRKVLVTGGGGFVGTNVVQQLKKEGAIVRATCHGPKPRFAIEGVEYVQADLTDREDCRKVMEGMDAVIMTAAFVPGAQGIVEKPMGMVTDTVILNLLTLEAACASGVKKVIYISSGIVYPFSKEPLTENQGFEGDPFEKYFTGGWSRRFTEVVCRMYAEKLKAMDITVLRLDNLYGPYDNFDHQKSHVVPALIRKAVERMDPLEVWGDGKDYKDFIYIEDLAKGVILALKKAQGFNVYNLASGNNVTINDVLKLILKAADYEDAKVVYNTSKPTMVPYKVLSVEKIRQELGFEANTSLEEGIAKTVAWYREHPTKEAGSSYGGVN